MKVFSLHLPRTASCVFGEGCETWFPVCWATAALRPLWGWSRWVEGPLWTLLKMLRSDSWESLYFLFFGYTVLHCFLKLVSSSPKKWWLLGCTPWLTGLQRDKEYRGALPADAFGDFLPQTPQIRLQVTMNRKFMLSQSWFKGTSAGFTPTFGVKPMVSCRCCHPVMRQNHLSWKAPGWALRLHPHREPCHFGWLVQSLDAPRGGAVLHRRGWPCNQLGSDGASQFVIGHVPSVLV